MNIRNEIKGYIKNANKLMKDVASYLEISQKNFNNKLTNETIRYSEIKSIANYIGYKIIWKQVTPQPNHDSLLEKIIYITPETTLSFLHTKHIELGVTTIFHECQDIYIIGKDFEFVLQGDRIQVEDKHVSIFTNDEVIFESYLDTTDG